MWYFIIKIGKKILLKTANYQRYREVFESLNVDGTVHVAMERK